MSRPAQVFAGLHRNMPAQTKQNKNVSLEHFTEPEAPVKPTNKDNEIRVWASGELSLPPDRCKVLITVSSKKDQVQDAKNSVSRRVDYIMQTLHNHHIKEGDISSTKALRRVDGLFHLDSEISVVFVDPSKCQEVCNFLAEKLDDSVKVSLPEYFQSAQRLENLRRQASLLAVSNAKQKAAEIAKFLNGSVGKATFINEESCSEWEGSTNTTFDPDMGSAMQQRQLQATVHVCVRVTASFELLHKARNNVKI